MGGRLFANQIALSWLCQTARVGYLTVLFKSDQSAGGYFFFARSIKSVFPLKSWALKRGKLLPKWPF